MTSLSHTLAVCLHVFLIEQTVKKSTKIASLLKEYSKYLEVALAAF